MEITERLTSNIATDESLDALENRLGTTLPDDYREFLKQFNGGRPMPREFVAIDGDEGSSVQFFFTLDEAAPHYYILKERQMFEGRIPDNTLPIACDSFGNLVLLDLGAKAFGAVYFWDHENENMDGDAYWDNVFTIAKSFNEFLSSLK
jgi:cell wall assembly regulator SMI1